MDNTNTSTPSSATAAPATPATPAAPSVTPFPAAGSPKAQPAPAETNAASDDEAATPLVDKLIQRATQGAHEAVDSLAAKVSSAVGGVQDGASKVTDTRDEWIGAARDAIRQHPFATVAGALLVGAAVLSLVSSRD